MRRTPFRLFLVSWLLAGGIVMTAGTAGEMPTTPASNDARATAWLAYWDWNGSEGGAAEALRFGTGLGAIQAFAATFDAEDALVLRDPIPDWIKTSRLNIAGIALKPANWLTVVNDSPAALKEPDLVHRLLAPGRRANHLAELKALAYGPGGVFAGIELDYERIRPEDWSAYLAFAADLHAALPENPPAFRPRVRVVLEPKAAYFKEPFPIGPEYVLMAYNLHGGHSGPGPKADPAFIDKLAALCKDMNPKPRLALATGGFDWGPSGKAAAVTERKAMELEKREGAVSVRDPVSRAKFFRYPLGAPRGQLHEVWYADGETLAFWAAHARKAGFDRFALWRLGGNDPVSLKTFLESEGLR